MLPASTRLAGTTHAKCLALLQTAPTHNATRLSLGDLRSGNYEVLRRHQTRDEEQDKRGAKVGRWRGEKAGLPAFPFPTVLCPLVMARSLALRVTKE